MKYNYSAEKDFLLIEERGISFDEIIAAIESDQVLDIKPHPNKERYPDQKLMVVDVKEYVYIVPFVEQENGTVFLKTIYPSRKAKKDYLKGDSYET